MNLNSTNLRTAPCKTLVPAYKEKLEYIKSYLPNTPYSPEYRKNLIAKIDEILQDPLEALRRQVSDYVEEKFKSTRERKLVLGCMHYPKNAHIPFIQTQTIATDLLPTNISLKEEDHRHATAVTIDLRAAPDELLELRLTTNLALCAKTTPNIDASPFAPDFARRNIEIISDLEDFKYVKNLHKIYLERVPNFEKGPSTDPNLSNIPHFYFMRQMLGKDGVLAFDYFPYISVFDNKGAMPSLTAIKHTAVPEKEISEREIEAFIKHSPFTGYFDGKEVESIEIPAHLRFPGITDVRVNLAKRALTYRASQEELKKHTDAIREDIKRKPMVDLTMREIFIDVYGERIHLKKVDANFLNKYQFTPFLLAIICSPDRTADQVNSINYQVECYRGLNVDPSLQTHITSKTKLVLDEALTYLVENVVFPRLESLGFARLAYNPNGINAENGRQFDRVVHVKRQ